MSIPRNKSELKEAIENNFQKLMTDLAVFNEKNASGKVLEGHAAGTSMSVADLVSYLIGWTDLVLLWIQEKEEGKEPEFPSKGFKWNELGGLAQKFYKDYDHLIFEEKLQALVLNVKSIQTKIEKTKNEVLYDQPFYKTYPLGRMIQLNTSSPFKNARTRIRKTRVFKQNSQSSL